MISTRATGCLLIAAMLSTGGVGAVQRVRAQPAVPGTGGSDSRLPPSQRPSVDAAFPRESYGPGAWASLTLFDSARALSIQIFRAGPEPHLARANDVMAGIPVSTRRYVGRVTAGRVIRQQLGNWPSGLYFARLTGAGNRVGYAPFVLRPHALGEHRVAVVLPTQTWQAYNFRDDDGDGRADTWYAGWRTDRVRLGRPFSDMRGVPPHYAIYDAPFLHWLVETGREADYLADCDLDRVLSGRRLAQSYDLIVFPGHHEYVTAHEYDVVTGFRNRGGNLAFLAADDFYWKVRRIGRTLQRVRPWRRLGRPEAGLIGVQFRAGNRTAHAPWLVRQQAATAWIFEGTGLEPGSTFGNGGVEVDSVARASPRTVHVAAEIPALFSTHVTAQMTYYERGAAKVFAAGAFLLVTELDDPTVSRIVANVWDRFDSDEPTLARAEPVTNR
jgi:hypothetical protein